MVVDLAGSSFDVILIPVHVHGNHWALLALDLRERKVHWWDSLVGTSDASEFTPFIDAALEWLEWVAGRDIAADTWTRHVHSEHVVPQQDNGCDCGIFAIAMARCIALGLRWDFSQRDVPFLRRWYALCTLETRL